jgi:hypothetical protein
LIAKNTSLVLGVVLAVGWGFLSAANIKKDSVVNRFLSRMSSNKKRKRRTVKVVNPLEGNCEIKRLSEAAQHGLVKGREALSFEYPEDFCAYFSKIKNLESQGCCWELVDAVALRLGLDTYTWKDMEQFVSVQAFLLGNGAGGIAFSPGFSAVKALCDEAALLGMSDGGTMADEVLDGVRAEWQVSNPSEFATMFRQQSGCSIPFFKASLRQKEMAMAMLHHFSPAKALTTTDFVRFLKSKGVAAEVRYNVDVAVLKEADVALYREGVLKPDWISFGLREEGEFCSEIRVVLAELAEGCVSEPIFLRSEYWLVRNNAVDVAVDEKAALLREMKNLWMEESIIKVLPKISCGVVKTVLVD